MTTEEYKNLTPEERKAEIEAARTQLGVVYGHLNNLVHYCSHKIAIKQPKPDGDYGGAYCEICGEGFGWYCPTSPDRYCHYNTDPHDESCIYCGEPDERK